MDPKEIIVRRDNWNDVETEFFTNRFNLYKDEVGKNKQFKNRKAMFSWIAGEMSAWLPSNKTEQQLTSRYYTLTRKTKKQVLSKSIVKNDESLVARASKPETIVDMNQVTFVDLSGIPIIGMDKLLVKINENSVGDENETIIIDNDDSNEVVGTVEKEISIVIDDESTENIVADATVTQNDTDCDVLSGIYRRKQSTPPTFGGPAQSIASTNVDIATCYSAPMENKMWSNNNNTAPVRARPSASSICAPAVTITGAFSLSNASRISTPLTAKSSSATSLRSTGSQKSTVAKKSVSWTVEETKWVLDQYYLYMDEVGPWKLFETKNEMWKTLALKMAEEFEEIRTGEQLSKRVADVVEQKKASIGRNHISGAVRELVVYEDEVDKITASDDSIEPEVMRSSDGKVRYKEKIESQIKKPRWAKPTKKGILNSLSETMASVDERKKERDEIKEKRREETHNALLEYLRSLKKPEN